MMEKHRDRKISPILEVATLIGRPLFGFSKSLPKLRVTRIERVVQMCASFVQVMLALRHWNRTVVLHGECFKRGHGRFQISVGRTFKGVMTDFIRLQPFAVVVASSDAKHPLSGLTRKLSLHEADALECKLAVADVLTFVGRSDDGIVHISCAFDERASSHLIKEEAALQWLQQRPDEAGFRSLYPAVKRVEQSGTLRMLTLSHVEGEFSSLATVDEQEFLERLKAAAKPLLRQCSSGKQLNDGPDHILIAEKLSQLPILYPQYDVPLGRLLAALSDWAGRLSLPAVVIHGDYHLGNVLFETDGRSVSGIIDWDRFRPEGLALLDALHLLVSSTARRRGVHFGEILPTIWEVDCSTGCERQFLAYLHNETTIGFSDIGMVGIVLWLNYLWLAHSEQQEIDDNWLERMTEGPAAAALTFVETNKNAKCESTVKNG